MLQSSTYVVADYLLYQSLIVLLQLTDRTLFNTELKIGDEITILTDAVI